MTGKMLASIEEVLLKEKPGKLLVYGNTTSNLSAALAAVKLPLPDCHAEAGNALIPWTARKRWTGSLRTMRLPRMLSPLEIAIPAKESSHY